MASSSPYLKLVSCRDHNIRVLSFEDDLLARPHLHHNHTNNRLSILSYRARDFRPVSLSSSHTQTVVHNDELLTQESSNGYTTGAEAETQTVCVQFQLQRECSFGQNFLITGDHPILGLWDPNNAISLTWSDGHIWTAHLDIPVGRRIKFKFIMQESSGKFVWQPGPDRVLECLQLQTQKIITLREDWENPDSRMIIETDIEFFEPEGHAINMTMKEVQVLVSDEEVPVLVPGLSNEDEPEPEAEPVNGPDLTITLPELDSKGDIPKPETSSVHENQESWENKHQEMQVAEEKDHLPISSLLLNDIQWSNNVMQKFLSLFGIH